MNYYLTRKSPLHPLSLGMEIVLFVCLMLWIIVNVYVFCEEFLPRFDWAVAATYLIILGPPTLALRGHRPSVAAAQQGA